MFKTSSEMILNISFYHVLQTSFHREETNSNLRSNITPKHLPVCNNVKLAEQMRLIVSLFQYWPSSKSKWMCYRRGWNSRHLSTCTVLQMACPNIWSPKANVWCPHMLNLTINSFDYIAKNIGCQIWCSPSLQSVPVKCLSDLYWQKIPWWLNSV